MSAKTSARRRAAFFTALADTGNQTISAERAKVSRSWVSLHRASDPEFRAQMEACVAGARARLAGEALMIPPRKWRAIDGEMLVIRGTNGRKVQVARAHVRQWSPQSEALFLQTLAATCNVKASCAEVGKSAASAYVRRRKWQSFADRWEEALETGYVRLELALVESACNTFDPPEVVHDGPMPRVTPEQALQLLRLHRHTVRGDAKLSGRYRRRRTLAEVQGSILRKIEAIQNAGARDRAAS